MKVKIFYHILPWEIDYALLSFTQLKKSKYYLDSDTEIIIDTHLNLSSYLINWEETKIPKEHFITKYNDLSVLLKDYTHNKIIYDGNENYGLFEMHRKAYDKDVDYYISICPDMYFSETALYSLIEASKVVSNKYFVITPEIHKMWDGTWDEITNKNYLNVPYDNWDKADIFDIRNNLKHSEDSITLEGTQKSKWAIWFDLYNKEFFEELCPLQDEWTGYGPWDWYSLMLTEYVKQQGVDFQQYVLRGQTIFEYTIGALKERGFSNYYKDFFSIKVGAKEQRDKFESKMREYLNKGVQLLKEKNII